MTTAAPTSRSSMRLALLKAPDDVTHLYVCGPAGFMNYILDAAQSAGWPQDRVHKEFFAADPVDQSANAPFEVELASSGQVFRIPARRSGIRSARRGRYHDRVILRTRRLRHLRNSRTEGYSGTPGQIPDGGRTRRKRPLYPLLLTRQIITPCYRSVISKNNNINRAFWRTP